MATKQVSIEDFPRLIPGVQFWAGHSARIVPNVLRTWDLLAYEKGNEIRSGDKSRRKASLGENEMRTWRRRQSPAAHVLVSDKLIFGPSGDERWRDPSERSSVNKRHASLIASVLSPSIFDAALQ